MTELSVCPALGMKYATLGATIHQPMSGSVAVDVSQVMVPIGVGIGKRFELQEGLVLVPSAMANLLHIREKGSVGIVFRGEPRIAHYGAGGCHLHTTCLVQ